MCFRSAIAAACLLTASAAAPAQAPPPELFTRIDAIVKELEAVTGLHLKHRVPSSFITKAKVKDFLSQRVKEVAKPADIRAEELTLKKFGLAPPDFDLAKTTIDLLTEQAAAFYDYDKKKLFITESTSPESQEPVLIHELAHALADQNFHLARFIRQGRKSDDGSTARLAVMEGQASWLMAECLARRNGQRLKDSPSLVATMSHANEGGDGQYPVLDRAPLYLRRSLIFPYSSGMLFQHAVYMKDGKLAFSSVFQRAPISTQQILHPDKYFAAVSPSMPALPEWPQTRGFKSLVGGVFGELEFSVLLEQFGSRELAAELAPHWRGSQFELRENRKQQRVVLLYSVEWDDEPSAVRYFDFYRQALTKKWKRLAIAADTPGALTGTGDDGRFELRRNGTIVSGIEGLPPAID